MKDFLQARLFSCFPSWKGIAYQKEISPKILRFEIQDQEEIRFLYLVSIISREEKMAWQSFQDVLGHTMSLAQKSIRGFFGFDVLSVDLQSGIRNFDPKALSQLIINHARVLGPDQKSLIRYGQLFALLHYRVPAEWGKIEVKTHVEFFSQASASAEVSEASVKAALMGSGAKNKNTPSDQMDLFLKKLVKKSCGKPDAMYIVHDLSVNSVWDPANEVQQQRARAWLGKEAQVRGRRPEIYYCHADKLILIKE